MTYNDMLCKNSSVNGNGDNSIKCDNFGEMENNGINASNVCYQNSEPLLNPNGSICCRGEEACAYGNGLSSSARIMGNSDASKQYPLSQLLCDGSSSCAKQRLFNSNGNIYCAGKNGCDSAKIYGNVNLDSANSESDSDSESVSSS